MKRMNKLYTLLFFCLSLPLAKAQVEYRTDDFTVACGAVVTLKDLGPGFDPVQQLIEAPIPSGQAYQTFLQEQKQAFSLKYPRQDQAALQNRDLAEPPLLLTQFAGNNSTTNTPMDNHLAVSNGGQIISVINSHVAVKDLAGDWIDAATLDNFTISLGIDIFKFDPRVLYDPEYDRYIVFMISGNSSFTNNVLVAFSQTNDAEGAWNLYVIDGSPFDNGTWADYPIVALADKEVFLTCNSVFNSQPWQTGFFESLIWQINKENGYNGEPLTIKLWSEIQFDGKPIRNLCPIKYATEELGDKMHFLSNRNFSTENDSIFILEIEGPQTTPGLELQIDVRKSDTPYAVPPDAVQPLGFLATNDARVLDGIYLPQLDQIQFVGNTGDLATGKAAFYHGVIDEVGGAREVSGYVVASPTDEYGYPSIAYTGLTPDDQDAILVFSHTSPTRFPGCSAIYFDNDRQHSEPVTIKEGLDYISMIPNEDTERWGDYSGNQRKYNEPGIVWCASSFGESNNDNDTWIGSLGRPDLFIDVQEPTAAADDLRVFPNPASDRVEVEYRISGKPWVRISLHDAEGRLVRDFQNDYPKGEGVFRFSFSTEPLPAGLYVLTISADGENIRTEKVIVAR